MNEIIFFFGIKLSGRKTNTYENGEHLKNIEYDTNTLKEGKNQIKGSIWVKTHRRCNVSEKIIQIVKSDNMNTGKCSLDKKKFNQHHFFSVDKYVNHEKCNLKQEASGRGKTIDIINSRLLKTRKRIKKTT